jgi:3',5'-nucleoside bisphosphate phosphatase
MSIDLHVHSTFSDGTKRPEELVELAFAGGLSVIAITDHDTVEGTAEAQQAGDRIGIQVIPGLELSVRHNDQALHILGYAFDPENPDLLATLTNLQEARHIRNEAILARLAELGIDVQMEEILRQSAMGQTGRPHIARVLMKKGYVCDMDEAFDQYLRRGAKAYVARRVYSADEAIALIHKAGGLSALAHPLNIDPSLRNIPSLLVELVALGLDGLEVYYPTHSAQARKKLAAMAKRYRLIATGGSDYHGEIRPGTTLAGGGKFRVPTSVLAELRQRMIS